MNVSPISTRFNGGATYTTPHAATSRPGVSAIGAAKEASSKLPEISQAKEMVAAKLGAEANDGGRTGGSGFAGKAASLVIGAGAALMGGPVGAAIGAGLAVAEGASFAVKSVSPFAEYEGKSDFADYSRSDVTPGSYIPLDSHEIKNLETYTCATGEVCTHGGWVQTPAQTAFQMELDGMEEKQLQTLHTQLARTEADLITQGDSAQAFARDNNLEVDGFAKGPKPPGMAGMGGPSMGMG